MKSLLDPSLRNNVAASYLIVAGHCMLNVNPLPINLGQNTAETLEGERRRLKKAVFDSFIASCASSSVHARCVAQWYVREMYKDDTFKQFIPESFNVIANYINSSKESVKILGKYDAFL